MSNRPIFVEMRENYMQKRDNRMSALIKSQNDEINALNSRFEAMKKSLNERYARELAQIKQKHKVHISHPRHVPRTNGLIELLCPLKHAFHIRH